MLHIEKEINEIKKEVISIRRTIHKYPETGLQEFKTSEFIANKLNEYGISIKQGIAKTGVIGYIKGNIGKNTIAFRADMDALDVNEENDIEYKSCIPGKMHACGHDGHVSIVLGLAKYLSKNKNIIQDNIVFVFQPAEEGPGGAEILIKEGLIEEFKIDKIIGLHIFPQFDEGIIACKKGPIMARTGEFNIEVIGKSGHGAIPQHSVDSIVVSANLVTALQTIVSRNINPIEGAVLTMGKIMGGEVRNVIAGKVRLEGTMRAFNDTVFESMKKRIKEIANGFEKSYNCKINVDFNDMYPAVNNDSELVEVLRDAVTGNYQEIEPLMIAEDFSYYQKKIPGLFFLLGAKNEELEYIHPLHNSKFNFNEDILVVGIQTYVNILKGLSSIK